MVAITTAGSYPVTEFNFAAKQTLVGHGHHEAVWQHLHHTNGFLCYISFSIPSSHFHLSLDAFATRSCKNKANSFAMFDVFVYVRLSTCNDSTTNWVSFSLLDSLTKNLRQFKFWLKSDKKWHFLLQALWVTRWLKERSYLLPTGNNGAHAAQLLKRFAFRMIQYWLWLFWVLASCVSERYCRRFSWTSTWSPCEGHFVNNSETWVVLVRWPEAWPSPTFVEIITNISAI